MESLVSESLVGEPLVSMERIGPSVVLRISNPPVNALTRQVAAELLEAWAASEADTAVARIVISGVGKMFVAGADLREIERITLGELPPDMSYLNELLNAIEQSRTLVVMAMNGGALGIGLELAMAGHYRVLAAGAKVGLPEVKLGLIPGAGGTQRLPRLVGIAAAIGMCVTGEAVGASEALEMGLVDQVVEGDVVEAALAVSGGRKTCDIACGGSFRVIEAVLAAGQAENFAGGLAEETRLFEQALVSAGAREKVRAFFAARRKPV